MWRPKITWTKYPEVPSQCRTNTYPTPPSSAGKGGTLRVPPIRAAIKAINSANIEPNENDLNNLSKL